jgi:hypothetical protein
MDRGDAVIFDIVAGGSILPRVRNGIVKRFIDSDADTLVFIDSDMVWEPETLAKLVYAPFDVSVANYRKRNNEVVWMAEPVTRDGQPVGATHNGDIWLQTMLAGTGLMSIKRRTIEEMVLRLPELSYEDNGEQIPCLFDFQMENGKYYGEDYTFCRRLTGIGGQIFILADADTGHTGHAVYTGNYHHYLSGSSQCSSPA